ncbi:MAG: DUF4249 family protein [Candidatus Cloacimonetes bacterium]|nr:DUF4249 family protein [Candidatus Cloacimonadota bacterium]
MVKLLRLMLPILLLFTVSCTKFTAPERFEGDVYTLAGLLIAGQAIDLEHPIYITRSATIEEFNPFLLFVSDASVTIKDLSNQTQWTLTPRPDLVEMKIKYVDADLHIIQPEHRYRIEIQIPGRQQLITAETTVPAQAQLVPDFLQNNVPGEGYSLNQENITTMKFSEIDLKYPLVMDTGSFSGACNFMAEIYCMEEFSTELEFTNSIMGIEHPSAEMETGYNASGESIRRIKFLGRYVSTPQEGLVGNYLVVEDYHYTFVFLGHYQVSIYVADDNYYRYTYMPEGYFYGGVQGALGYFGSATGGKMYTEIVR